MILITIPCTRFVKFYNSDSLSEAVQKKPLLQKVFNVI